MPDETAEAAKKTKDSDDCSAKTATMRDVCDALQCSAQTVRRMIARGDFPAPAYVGAKPMWLRETVHQWFEDAAARRGRDNA